MGYAAELPQRWTGVLELDLLDADDRWTGTIEFTFRYETIELRLQGRLIAAMPRDGFRYWISRRTHPYRIDDVCWWMYEGQLLIWIQGLTNYGLTPQILHRLVTVL